MNRIDICAACGMPVSHWGHDHTADNNRVDRAIAEAGEAVDAVTREMPHTAKALEGLQEAVDAACAEIDRLREVNSVCVAKLRELYDYFVHEADRCAGRQREQEMLTKAAEITEVLDKAGAL